MPKIVTGRCLQRQRPSRSDLIGIAEKEDLKVFAMQIKSYINYCYSFCIAATEWIKCNSLTLVK